ncbi:MAG: hypothetical protein JKY51_01895 [Opitutaceae bacterium]|nr:hypothetical protein [Opitutaceae bacterium]
MNKLEPQIKSTRHELLQTHNKLTNLNNHNREKKKAELFKKQIIIGQFFLAKMQMDDVYSKDVIKELDLFIIKAKDRELFDLPTVTTSDSDEAPIQSTKNLV